MRYDVVPRVAERHAADTSAVGERKVRERESVGNLEKSQGVVAAKHTHTHLG